MITTDQISLFRTLYLAEAQDRFKRLFDLYGVAGIENLLENEIPKQRAAQIASIISPLNEAILNSVSDHFDLWEFAGDDGGDSCWDGVLMEHKLSLSLSNSWTGHPYSQKVPWHLLMKLGFEKNRISKLCMFLVDLEKCCEYSQWPTESDGSNSFASLRIHISDVDQIIPIFGGLRPCKKYCGIVYENV
jgi:hypothetical protein